MAPAGRVLLSGDYAQMELRLMGHFSEDPSLVAMLSAPDQDPFRHWAAQWLRKPPAEVTTPPPCWSSVACVATAMHGLAMHERTPAARGMLHCLHAPSGQTCKFVGLCKLEQGLAGG